MQVPLSASICVPFGFRCPGVNSVTSTSSEPNETNMRDRIQGEGKKPSAKHLTRLQKMRIPELASEQQHLKKEEEIHKHKQDVSSTFCLS